MEQLIKLSFKVKKMHCQSCKIRIENEFLKLEGMEKIEFKMREHLIIVTFTKAPSLENLEVVKTNLAASGYEVLDSNESLYKSDLLKSSILAVVIWFAIYLVTKIDLGLLPSGNTNSLLGVFSLGVLASLSSCLAITGGLILAIFSTVEKVSQKISLAVRFHVSRLFTFLVLGMLIGYMGRVIAINQNMTLTITILVSIAMITLGLLQLGIFEKFHFSFFTKNTHRKIIRLIDTNKSATFLGVLTFFIPCGFTQSVQLQAFGLANPIQSGLFLLMFALGTLPVLLVITLLPSKQLLLGEKININQVGGALVVIMGLVNICNVLYLVI